MTFRTRLLMIFTVAVAAAVGLVEWIVSGTTRDAFERVETKRINGLVAQFRREFHRRGDEIVRAVNAVAESDEVLSTALASDFAPYYGEASSIAQSNGLELMELVAGDGAIISSAEWPARFGYKEDWLSGTSGWTSRGAFLRREELPDGAALALVAVAEVTAGDRKLYVTGGQRIGREFLSSLVMPEGMRVLLYQDLSTTGAQFLDASGAVLDPGMFFPVIHEVQQQRRETTQTVGTGAAAEIVHALPLAGLDNGLLGILLVSSSRRELVEMEASLHSTGWMVAAGGILVGMLLSWWATARVTKPVRALAVSSEKVAAGNWAASVPVTSNDEMGQLARAFNRMTSELVAQRERLLQAERVAAWKELARRLAHELKNPLFPLQITVENMRRAHDSAPDQFEEVFREGTGTLLAELGSLKQIISRFSDFAKMPAPDLRPVDLNQLVSQAAKLFEPQLAAAHILLLTESDPNLGPIAGDADQLTRVLHNLILNAIDAMPRGGELTIRTIGQSERTTLEVSDTGQGLTPEECDRLFTPYYTTKTHGTGLGLAIVQSVVSDHKGRISVSSQPGKGTTFRIDLVAA
ncbi:MAG: HAMP domain-containing protein [Acidobacteriia bacterium]|nr:HAMP domain-containing protein [Terriglobia bacterium]